MWATWTPLTGHIQPAGRVFETPALILIQYNGRRLIGSRIIKSDAHRKLIVLAPLYFKSVQKRRLILLLGCYNFCVEPKLFL